MIRRSSAAIAALVATLDRAQIQRVHHIAYKQRQMPLRQPLLQICRQQQLLLWIVAQVDSAHTSHYNSSSSLFSQKSLGLFRQAPRVCWISPRLEFVGVENFGGVVPSPR